MFIITIKRYFIKTKSLYEFLDLLNVAFHLIMFDIFI